MIDQVIRGYADTLQQVSGVKRVIDHPRHSINLMDYTVMYGSEIDFIAMSYDSVRPNFSVTSSVNASTWYDVEMNCSMVLKYVDHENYNQSSQFVFDSRIDKLLSKFNKVTMLTVDSSDKIRFDVIPEITLPNNGVIISTELNQLVHYAEWKHTISFIF